jgi:hypothetical protein
MTSLYLDGTLVGTAPYDKGFGSVTNTARHFVGSCSLYPNNSFRGEVDEVRLWRVARTADEIRQNMSRPLTGRRIPQQVSRDQPVQSVVCVQ